MCYYDLISGFFSKAKSQTLRVAVCLHVLFNIESPDTIPAEIAEAALKAAIVQDIIPFQKFETLHLANANS